MTYIIKYSSILSTKKRLESRFGGSSKFKVIDDELVDLAEKRKYADKPQKKHKVQPNKVEVSESEETPNKEPEKKKGYTLNKSKIKRKCHAFSRLEKSKKFLAFYSISFPLGLEDNVCYKLFNTWLTRCRKNCGLNSYLWVAERQKNGTIHFHLLTNDFMSIGSVNGFMAKALASEKKKGTNALAQVNTDKYNGVDVKRVGNDTRLLINYLAKYITKNEIEFYRLPWHCSRDISRLFTSTNFERDNSAQFVKPLPRNEDKYTEVVKSDFFEVIGFKFTPSNQIFEDIDGLNELIYTTN